MNYNRVLNTRFQQNRKEVKMAGENCLTWSFMNVPFDRHISDKLKGNSDERDGTYR